MKRWNNRQGNFVEIPDIDAFLADIEEVCRRHKMSIGHEDTQGAFVIYDYNKDDVAWIGAAHDARIKPK